MNYIYIAHAENEEKVASQLKQYLKFSFETWCPFDDAPFGEDLSNVIPQKIKEASALLVVLSDKAKESRQLFRELHLADKYSIPVIPVTYGKIAMTESLEYYFSGIPMLDISKIDTDLSCLNAILSELKKYAGSGDYDNLIDVDLDEGEPEEIVYTEDTSSLREKVKELVSSLPDTDAQAEPDYDNIVSTQDALSLFFEEEDVNAELSLATEGCAFTRYIFNVPAHTTAETLESLKGKIALAYEGSDCYFTEDNGGVVIDVPKAEKAQTSLSAFFKSEGFLSTKHPTLIAGKDVNENCIFIDLQKAKYLLVVGDDMKAREKFLDLCYLSLKAKFSDDELQIRLCNSVAGGLFDLNTEIPTVLLITDVNEEGLYESLQTLPENVYAVVEAEAEDIENLSLFKNKVVFHRNACKCHARYLTDGELMFRTDDFRVRVLMPEFTEEEGEKILISAACQSVEPTVETEEIAENVTEEPVEVETEEPAVEVELTVDDVPVANITEDIFAEESEVEIEITDEPVVTTEEGEIVVDMTDDGETATKEDETTTEEEVVAEEPMEEIAVEETAIEKIATEEPVETETVEIPAAEEIIAEETVTDEPVAEETVAEEPTVPQWTKVPFNERPSELYLKALQVFITRNAASISILQQRPLLMNYTKASEVYMWMAEKGYISEPDEHGYRKLLITADDYKTLYE